VRGDGREGLDEGEKREKRREKRREKGRCSRLSEGRKKA
jgi:hypothetical protein